MSISLNQALKHSVPTLVLCASILPLPVKAQLTEAIASTCGGFNVITDSPLMAESTCSESGASSARATATYSALSSYVSAYEPTGKSYIFGAAAAAFIDTLTISSPGRVGTQGYADFLLDYSWSVSAAPYPGAAMSLYLAAANLQLNFGTEYAVADELYEVDTSGPREVVRPLLTSSLVLADGAVLGDYFSVRMPFTFGTASTLRIALQTSAQARGGSTEVDVSNAVYWGGMSVYDSNGVQVSFSVSAASGTNYALSYAPATVTPVPEPSTYALLSIGLGFVAIAARRRRETDA